MNAENLNYLRDRLKFLGFQQATIPLEEELETQLKKDEMAFDLYTEVYYDDCKVEATLHFEHSADRTKHLFKKYVAVLRYSHAPERDRIHTFYIFKGHGCTLKEAFNLLEGRSINKNIRDAEDLGRSCWSWLDFDEKTELGNYKIRISRTYDLEKALQAYPIAELKSEMSRDALLDALRRGNSHPVFLMKGHKRTRVFIEASPQNGLLIIRPQLMGVPFPNILPTETQAMGEGSDPGEAGGIEMSAEVEVIGTPSETEAIAIPSEVEESAEEPDEEQVRTTRIRSSQRRKTSKA